MLLFQFIIEQWIIKTELYHVKNDKTESERSMDQSLIKYRAFVKTVECGSLAEAAQVLNYSPSGISRMITRCV